MNAMVAAVVVRRYARARCGPIRRPGAAAGGGAVELATARQQAIAVSLFSLIVEAMVCVVVGVIGLRLVVDGDAVLVGSEVSGLGDQVLGCRGENKWH